MDKRRTVVNESHGLSLGKPGSVATGDEGNAKAVEAGINARRREQMIDSAVFVARQLASEFPALNKERLEQWAKAWVDGNCKILAWVALFTLGIAQPNSSGCEVDVFHWNRAFGKPATCVESNFKADPHPFGLVLQLVPDRGNVCIRQFRLFFGGRPANPETGNRVGFSELAPDRFVDELGKEFQFEERCIVTDGATVNIGFQPPTDIRLAVGVLDLARVNDALCRQERFNGLPCGSIAPCGIAALRPMGRKITGHPGQESRGIGRASNPLFLGGRFIGQPLSFAGISLAVGSEAGGFLNPQSGIQVAPTQIPERGSPMLPNMSHGPRVAASRSFVKWNNCVYLWEGWTKNGLNQPEQFYHYTTRLNNHLKWNDLRFSRSSVAHLGRIA